MEYLYSSFLNVVIVKINEKEDLKKKEETVTPKLAGKHFSSRQTVSVGCR
jgi:hypothetical protein